VLLLVTCAGGACCVGPSGGLAVMQVMPWCFCHLATWDQLCQSICRVKWRASSFFWAAPTLCSESLFIFCYTIGGGGG